MRLYFLFYMVYKFGVIRNIFSVVIEASLRKLDKK